MSNHRHHTTVILTNHTTGVTEGTAMSYDPDGRALPSDVWRIMYPAGHAVRIPWRDIPDDYKKQINLVLNALGSNK